MFEEGQVYNRRNDIHANYGGTWQSGIVTLREHPYILLFQTHRGRNYGYIDEMSHGEFIKYSGEGMSGNMEFTRGNKAILNHQSDGKSLFVFTETARGFYQCLGEYEYLSHDIVNSKDSDSRHRDAIIFTLQKVN